MKLWNYLKEKMMEHPEQIVCEGEASMTYEELCIFAENRAQNLDCHRYAILCNSEMATAMSLLSCIAAEKIAIPLPMRYGSAHYGKLLQAADPSAVLTDFCGCISAYPYSDKSQQVANEQKAAVVLFTSGSIGDPKGVMLSEQNLIANIESIGAYFPIGKEDTILIARPLYHACVLTGEFLLALCKGARIVFSSEPFQPLNVLTLMKKHKVTVYGSTPTLLSNLARFVRKQDDLSVKLLSVSGECMTEGMAKAIRNGFPNADVYCGYGLSEASPRVAYLPADLFDAVPTVTGIPVSDVKVRLIDTAGNLICHPFQMGELLVQGSNVMLGYFNDPEHTANVLVDGWLHTGDLAYWDRLGRLCVQGRKDDMIIRAGMNVYPSEIENVLSKDLRIKDVLVYGYEKNDTQEIGLKICGDFSNTGEIMELCRNVLPQFQIPSKIELVEDAAVLFGGKKKRKDLVNACTDQNCFFLDPGMGYEGELLQRVLNTQNNKFKLL